MFDTKQKVIDTILTLNKAILTDFIILKRQFQSTPISNNEISNKLKTWKPIFEQTVQNNIKQLKNMSISSLQNQQYKIMTNSQIVKNLTKKYGFDQQYIEAIKCLNSTTQMIKQYIRIKAIKDPTTAVIERQVTSSQNVIVGSVRNILT